MKKLIVIVGLSFILTSNIKDAQAQAQLITTGLSLIGNTTTGLTGDAAACATELYHIVSNFKCLKMQFNFYMNYIKNNNDCSFNLNRQKTQDNMAKLEAQLESAAVNTYNKISSIIGGGTTNSQTPLQQVRDNLKEAENALVDIENFVYLICEAIRVESDNQISVSMSASYSGHEISQSMQGVL